MEISAQILSTLIEEGLQLSQTGCKIQESRAIHWYIKSKSTIDNLHLQPKTLDKFKYSLDIEERVNILKMISNHSVI